MTDLIPNALHQSIEVSDPLFYEQSYPLCTLCIEIDARFIRFCIIENVSRKCKWLASYPFESIQHVDDLLKALQERITTHPILSLRTWGSIVVSFHSEVFTYIPSPLFEETKKLAYISFLLPQQVYTEQTVFTDHLRIINAHAVYVAPPTIVTWLQEYYAEQSIRFCHYTEAMIYHTITENYTTLDRTRMNVLINQDQLTIVVVKGPQLNFCNTFTFQTLQELTYYILVVLQQLQIEQTEVQVVLHGDVSHNDAIQNELSHFIEHVQIGRKPATLSYAPQMTQLETPWFHSLFHTYFMVF